MKNLRRLCAGLVLTFILAVPAFAGQMDCPGVVQPPPPGQNITSDTASEPDGMTSILVIFIDTILSLV